MTLLKVALNGDRAARDHPRLPITGEQLSTEAIASVRAGAHAVHLHPRDENGAESLLARVVDPVVKQVRERCGSPVGVSTGAWIEPDPERRAALVRTWTEPDFASVNLSEPGAAEVIQACRDAGVAVEAGVWSVCDAERLAAAGQINRVLRILVELVEVGAADAVQRAAEIHAALDRLGCTVPRLQHGENETAWVGFDDAIARGLSTRVGLEDALALPNGQLAAGNAELVAFAVKRRDRERA